MAETQRKSKGLSLCAKIALVFAATILAIGIFLGQRFQSKSWYTAPNLSYDKFLSDNYTTPPIPTTYYKVGELGKVLKSWYVPSENPNHDKSMEGYIHLFRVAPDSPPFKFDLNKVTAKTQVEFFMDPCPYPESVMCKPCLFSNDNKLKHESTVVNVSDILATPNNMYSSFGKLDDLSSVRSILDAVQIPNLDLSKVNLEHAFIGNFDRDRITAFLHCASVQSSMAVQFVGSKVWLFFPPQVMKNKDMMYSYSAAGISVPTKGPDGHFWLYRYESQPGDIFFFSENWGHTVLTKQGPNFMMTFRRLEIGNVMRRPLEWLQAVYNGILNKNQALLGRQRTPFNDLLYVYLKKINALCEDNNNVLSPWDRAMVDLMMGRANKGIKN